MAAPASKLSIPPTCPKCGNNDPAKFTISFVRANQEEGKDYEFVRMACNPCGYQEEKLPLDAA